MSVNPRHGGRAVKLPIAKIKNLTGTQLKMAQILNTVNGKESAFEFIDWCNEKQEAADTEEQAK